MADKEYRIAIHQVLYPCKKCSINCNKNDLKYCDFYRNYISGMTRQETIEKMAKAIFTQIWGLPNNRFDLAKSSVKVRNRKLAEAALNALLEGHNDER